MPVVHDMVQVPHFLARDLFDYAKASDNTCTIFATFSKIERRMGAGDEFPTAQYIYDEMVALCPRLYAMNVEKSSFDVLNALYFAAVTMAGYKCARLAARMDDFSEAREAVSSVKGVLTIACERRLIKGHNRPRGGWNEIMLGPWKSHLLAAKQEVMYDDQSSGGSPSERWCRRMDDRLGEICRAVQFWPARH